MSLSIHKFKHDSDLVDEFSRRICQLLEQAVTEREHAYLVVSGGRTPVALFERLSKQVLPWPQITILLADERWLSANDANSNERLVRQHLLQHQAAAANFISLLTDADDAHEALDELNQRVAVIPCFDVVLLGMGEDGHTASLFPDSPEAELEHALNTSDPVAAITPRAAPYQRVTLTRSRLMHSRIIFFQLSGTAKQKVLEQAVVPAAGLPVSRFLQQQEVPVEVMLATPEE
ncbi:6-phosphogluconolactonase [Pseudidiomarina insulisalsae]|uniref:6-phosphogluconolactonase n=1 Tax=Pseudidiomarina insulisalsae TaxID=575789 RepID=A0A432YML4_9GAMM|nr:6-phosphogluconolactonase [Pseudidiomarina insulisalsae]RUO62231.1 6-phosphogluconolactonase [Pseudidiomarina insulisalsae]